MPRAQVPEKDVDALLQSVGKLSVQGHYHWKRTANKSWTRIDVPVVIEDKDIKDVSLRISVSVSSETGKSDFALIWNGNICVRRLCVNGSHTNKHTNAERWIRRTHKHRWTDICMDRFAYTPTDITAVDLHGHFAQFCAECGISCSATLAPLPVTQGGLFDEL
jgi:hypothetical protein